MEDCGSMKNIKKKNNKKITIKYISDHRKHRFELEDEQKCNPTEFL